MARPPRAGRAIRSPWPPCTRQPTNFWATPQIPVPKNSAGSRSRPGDDSVRASLGIGALPYRPSPGENATRVSLAFSTICRWAPEFNANASPRMQQRSTIPWSTECAIVMRGSARDDFLENATEARSGVALEHSYGGERAPKTLWRRTAVLRHVGSTICESFPQGSEQTGVTTLPIGEELGTKRRGIAHLHTEPRPRSSRPSPSDALNTSLRSRASASW